MSENLGKFRYIDKLEANQMHLCYFDPKLQGMDKQTEDRQTNIGQTADKQTDRQRQTVFFLSSHDVIHTDRHTDKTWDKQCFSVQEGGEINKRKNRRLSSLQHKNN